MCHPCLERAAHCPLTRECAEGPAWLLGVPSRLPAGPCCSASHPHPCLLPHAPRELQEAQHRLQAASERLEMEQRQKEEAVWELGRRLEQAEHEIEEIGAEAQHLWAQQEQEQVSRPRAPLPCPLAALHFSRGRAELCQHGAFFRDGGHCCLIAAPVGGGGMWGILGKPLRRGMWNAPGLRAERTICFRFASSTKTIWPNTAPFPVRKWGHFTPNSFCAGTSIFTCW